MTERFNIAAKVAPELHVAAIRLPVPSMDQARRYLNGAYDELLNFMHRHNMKIQFCTGMICHSAPAQLENVDLEAILIVKSPHASSGNISFYKLPETLVVSGVLVGDFSGISGLHVALNDWIAANGYVINGAYREFYLKHDLRNLKDTITEVQYPVRK